MLKIGWKSGGMGLRFSEQKNGFLSKKNEKDAA